MWRNWGYATPKYTDQAYWLFQAEGTWEAADDNLNCPFLPVGSHKNSCEKDASCVPREDNTYLELTGSWYYNESLLLNLLK